jgi:DNA-binding beta-propeller fold protein YncE
MAGRRVGLTALLLILLSLLYGCWPFDWNRPPRASFEYAPLAPKIGEEVIFDASGSFDPDGMIVSYEWSFGDGASAAGVTATHAYDNAGDYTVSLKVRDDKGAADVAKETVSVSARAIPLVSFSAPGSEPTGLAWDGTFLWNADAGTLRIYKLDPDDGRVIDSFAAPGFMPEGLAWDGSALWNADAGEGKIYKIDPVTGQVLASFEAPGVDPSGLTWDGSHFWCTDIEGTRIYKLDSRGNIASSFPSPGEFPRGLAWDGEHLWNADGMDGMIYKLDPSSGQVLGSFAAPGKDPTGLAWDGTALWVADGLAAQISRISPP